MSSLQNEVDLIQNPALGALVVWHFVLGYSEENDRGYAPFNLVYLALPLVANNSLRSIISSTNAGLYKVKAKVFESGRGSDLLLLRETIPLLYELSSASIGIAISAGLVEYNESCFGLTPSLKTAPNSLTSIERDYKNASKKVGKWMAHMSLWEICSTLGVSF